MTTSACMPSWVAIVPTLTPWRPEVRSWRGESGLRGARRRGMWGNEWISLAGGSGSLREAGADDLRCRRQPKSVDF